MHVRLYKRSRRGIRYWEAWTRGLWGVVHEGRIGDRGKSKHLPPWPERPVEQQIAEGVAKARGKGYAEIPREEQYQVVVQYRLQTWGSVEDLDKAHEIEHLFNERLGWTGNGFCDGNDIGSGCLNIFSIVVDAELAVQTMVAELQKHELLDGAVIAARYGDEEEYRVLYPSDFKGEFSLF
jgi:hypothetical protein